METNSGLSNECHKFVGQHLSIMFCRGWGWTINRNDGFAEAFPEEESVNLTSASVLIESFFDHNQASPRGFLGRLVGKGHPLHELPIVAITMSDGFHYDFTEHVCQSWRFWIGEGDLICPPDSFPLVRGPLIIGGYGEVRYEP